MSQEPSDAAPHDERGEPESADRLLALVYEELRELAARKMAREGPNQTLQATALVHEAWLRLGGQPRSPWQNRAHFFAAAANAMRRILIDNARRKKAQLEESARVLELSLPTAKRHWAYARAWLYREIKAAKP